jgi:hypothetical protein
MVNSLVEKSVIYRKSVYLASNDRFLKIGVSKNIQPRLYALNSRYVNKERQFKLITSFYPIIKARVVESFLFDCCYTFRELGEFYEHNNIAINCFDWVSYNFSTRTSALVVHGEEDPSYIIEESKNSLELLQNMVQMFEDCNYPYGIEISKKTKSLCDRYPVINSWYY